MYSGRTQLAEQGALTSRIYAAQLETGWEDQAKIGLRRGFGSAFLRLGAVKGFADGSLGSETAYFFEPFTDAPESHGLLSGEMQPPGAMLKRLSGADAAGLQLCIRAIGDRTISMTLDNTLGSAYAEFQERAKGSISVGKLADFVVLDADLFQLSPTAIKDVKVVATVVGGKVVFGEW